MPCQAVVLDRRMAGFTERDQILWAVVLGFGPRDDVMHVEHPGSCSATPASSAIPFDDKPPDSLPGRQSKAFRGRILDPSRTGPAAGFRLFTLTARQVEREGPVAPRTDLGSPADPGFGGTRPRAVELGIPLALVGNLEAKRVSTRATSSSAVDTRQPLSPTVVVVALQRAERSRRRTSDILHSPARGSVGDELGRAFGTTMARHNGLIIEYMSTSAEGH